MLIRRAPDIRPSEITPESIYLDRRAFMVGAGSILAGSALLPAPAMAAVETKDLANIAKSKYVLDEKINTYKEITTYNNFYEYGIDKSDPSENAPDLLRPSPWTVKVDGECAKPGTIEVNELSKRISQNGPGTRPRPDSRPRQQAAPGPADRP